MDSIATATGRLERVRYPLVYEHTAEHIATRTIGHRRDLASLTRPLDGDDETTVRQDSQDDDQDDDEPEHARTAP